MVLVKAAPNKNASGQLGPICGNCGGYGFTLGISGRDHGCSFCNQTGVAQTTAPDLEARITKMELEFQNLKSIILKELRRAK